MNWKDSLSKKPKPTIPLTQLSVAKLKEVFGIDAKPGEVLRIQDKEGKTIVVGVTE